MYAVIMAGGRGTRFWPCSTQLLPKQLLAIVGEHTMLQQTLARLDGLVPAERVLIVTNAQQAAEVRRQVPAVPAGNVLIEPCGRNTAACICLAASRVARDDPQAVMAVLPADHYIAEVAAFQQCLARAVTVARQRDVLVTIGIRPDRPETGYGYLESGRPLPGCAEATAVVRFHEKPDLATAAGYLAHGGYWWNSGMFVWRAGMVLSELERHAPEIAGPIARVGPSWGTARQDAAVQAAYDALPSVSIDYAVMEKSDAVVALPGDFGWNDIGSWSALYDVDPADASGNVLAGDVLAHDSRRCLVRGGARTVALVGLEDVMVIDAERALLVCRRDRAQDVRAIVAQLEETDRDDLL